MLSEITYNFQRLPLYPVTREMTLDSPLVAAAVSESAVVYAFDDASEIVAVALAVDAKRVSSYLAYPDSAFCPARCGVSRLALWRAWLRASIWS